MSKKIKIENEAELKLISMEVDVFPRVRPPPKSQLTSAYALSARDDLNLKTIVKDPLSIRTTNQESQPTASRTLVRTLSSQDNVWEAEDPRVPLVSREDKQKALKMWKDKMIVTDDYKPYQKRTEAECKKEIKFLKTAMADFRMLKIKGPAALKTDHPSFRTIQNRYYIPKDFCMPEQFFREVQLNNNALYWKRCCSMQDFYHMCCMDTPFYVEKKKSARRDLVDIASNVNLQKNTAIAEVQTSYRRQGDEPSPSTRAWFEQPQRQLAVMKSQNQDALHLSSSNPGRLNEEQIESAEQAEKSRSAPRRKVPIPQTDDEFSDGETNFVFENKLLPDQKARISKLLKEMKRIKSKDYSRAYLDERDSDIRAAEAERNEDGLGPEYLAGVKSPWTSDRGHAPIHYDAHRISLIERQIENIKSSNATMCQLEYTATKGGPGGQARN